MTITYNKLVRDRIPEIIHSSGKTCSIKILSDEEYLKLVDAKLDEELVEYHKDQNIEELARSSTEVNKDDTREKIQSFILHYSGRAVLCRDQLHRHAANSGRGRTACRGTGCRCRRREGGGAQRRSPRAERSVPSKYVYLVWSSDDIVLKNLFEDSEQTRYWRT